MIAAGAELQRFFSASDREVISPPQPVVHGLLRMNEQPALGQCLRWPPESADPIDGTRRSVSPNLEPGNWMRRRLGRLDAQPDDCSVARREQETPAARSDDP